MKREPAAFLSLITAALALGVSLGIPHLSSAQAALIVAFIVAVGGAVIAFRTRPVTPGAFTAVVSAGSALLAGYGYNLRPGVVGAVSGLVLAVLALVTRAQVSPTGDVSVADVRGDGA